MNIDKYLLLEEIFYYNYKKKSFIYSELKEKNIFNN
jgi:hypothetical protein